MKEIRIKTSKKEDIIDITKDVVSIVKESEVENGLCVVYCPHTTGAITINENYDSDVKDDLLYALSKIIPKEGYKHSEGNSDAHLLSSLIGCEKTIIIKNKEAMLGRWQGIFFTEYDGPRERKVFVKCISEKYK